MISLRATAFQSTPLVHAQSAEDYAVSCNQYPCAFVSMLWPFVSML
jgi:hypothetical protein